MRSAIILVVLLSAAPSYAQRPSTLSMSCAEAQGVVASQGAIVLSTGRHTYDRFVATPDSACWANGRSRGRPRQQTRASVGLATSANRAVRPGSLTVASSTDEAA